MLSLYFIFTGTYLYYSKSKYFPVFLPKAFFKGSNGIGLLFLAIGTGRYVNTDGWASGLLISLAACSLAALMIQFFSVLGKKYFYGLVAILHGLLLIELISYAG